MPFDKDFLTNDMPTTLAYLKLTLASMRDDLAERMDPQAIANELRAG